MILEKFQPKYGKKTVGNTTERSLEYTVINYRITLIHFCVLLPVYFLSLFSLSRLTHNANIYFNKNNIFSQHLTKMINLNEW